jgi:hypothetical protein
LIVVHSPASRHVNFNMEKSGLLVKMGLKNPGLVHSPRPVFSIMVHCSASFPCAIPSSSPTMTHYFRSPFQALKVC